MGEKLTHRLASFQGTVGSLWIWAGSEHWMACEQDGLVMIERRSEDLWHVTLTDAGRAALAADTTP